MCRGIPVRRGVEEHANPREILLLDEIGNREIRSRGVRAKDVREVPDSHVVRDDSEVFTSQLLARGGQVANRSLERLLGVEACIDHAPFRPETFCLGHVSALDGVRDLNCQPATFLEVDGHAEEVLRGLGEDLREAGRRHRIVPRDDLRPAATLEEHDRFDQVGLESAARDGVLDERPEELRALGGREDASRALGVERVAEPERGSTLEVFGLRVVVHEHVAARNLRTGHEHACGVVSGSECDPACEGGRGEDGDQQARDEPSAAQDLAIA